MAILPVVLTIASSDNSGGAGVGMDLYAFNMLRVHGCAVVAGVSAQNSREFKLLKSLDMDTIKAQLDATFDDFDVRAVKTGMLGSGDVVEFIAGYLNDHAVSKDNHASKLVVDPVMGTTVAGKLEGSGDIVNALREHLSPLAYILIPNIPEAEALLGSKVSTANKAEVEQALRNLQELGAKNILLKGGHAETSKEGTVSDWLLDEDGKMHEFSSRFIPGGPIHGTGCMLSALITAHLGLGFTSAYQVVAGAESILHECLVHAEPIGKSELRYINTGDCGGWQMHQARVQSALGEAKIELEKILTKDLVPEVGINFGYAIPAATSTDDICALDARIIKTADGVQSVGGLSFGASSHVARIILAAMSFDLRYRSALNLRYSESLVDSAKAAGLRVGTFSREHEPTAETTMEWGTKSAIADLGHVPDVIYDLGGVGKEAMVRILGLKPADVVRKIKMLLNG